MTPFEEKAAILRAIGEDPLKTALFQDANGQYSLVDVPDQHQGMLGTAWSGAKETIAPTLAGLAGGAAAMGATSAIPGLQPVTPWGVLANLGAGAIGTGLASYGYNRYHQATTPPQQLAVEEVQNEQRRASHPNMLALGKLAGSALSFYPSAGAAKVLAGAVPKIMQGSVPLAKMLPHELEALGNAAIGVGLGAKPTYERITKEGPWTLADTIEQTGELANIAGRPTKGLGTVTGKLGQELGGRLAGKIVAGAGFKPNLTAGQVAAAARKAARPPVIPGERPPDAPVEMSEYDAELQANPDVDTQVSEAGPQEDFDLPDLHGQESVFPEQLDMTPERMAELAKTPVERAPEAAMEPMQDPTVYNIDTDPNVPENRKQEFKLYVDSFNNPGVNTEQLHKEIERISTYKDDDIKKFVLSVLHKAIADRNNHITRQTQYSPPALDPRRMMTPEEYVAAVKASGKYGAQVDTPDEVLHDLTGQKMGGRYNPNTDTISVPPDAPRDIAHHENAHRVLEFDRSNPGGHEQFARNIIEQAGGAEEPLVLKSGEIGLQAEGENPFARFLRDMNAGWRYKFGTRDINHLGRALDTNLRYSEGTYSKPAGAIAPGVPVNVLPGEGATPEKSARNREELNQLQPEDKRPAKNELLDVDPGSPEAQKLHKAWDEGKINADEYYDKLMSLQGKGPPPKGGEEQSFAYAPLATAAPDQVFGSVFDSAVRASQNKEAMGRYLKGAAAEKRALIGKGATADKLLSQYDDGLVTDTIAKLNQTMMTGTKPALSVDEQAIAKIWMDYFHGRTAAGRAVGLSPGMTDWYVPHSPDPIKLEAASTVEGREAVQKEYMALNKAIYGIDFDPVEANDHFNRYIDAATSTGGLAEFNPLHKSARKYFLPDSLRETDPRRILERYNNRSASEIAREKMNQAYPAAANELGFDVPGATRKDPTFHVEGALKDAVDYLHDRLSLPNRRTTAISDNLKALQNLAYAGAIQTPTGLRNNIQNIAKIMTKAKNFDDITAIAGSALRIPAEYQDTLMGAIDAGALSSRPDYQKLGENATASTRNAQRMNNLAKGLYKWTGAAKLEEFSRVVGFQAGKDLAEVNLDKFLAGDPSADRFMQEYGAGLDSAMSREEMVNRIAGNFVADVQTTYSAEDNPAALLRGPGAIMLRLQRYGVADAGRTYNSVVRPAIEDGNFMPLAMLMGMTWGFTLPAIQALNEALSGLKSQIPTGKEIEAGAPPAKQTVEKVLSLMEQMEVGGFFGAAGTLAGRVASAARGRGHSQLLEPMSDLIINKLGGALVRASVAVDNGMPAGEAALAVFGDTVKGLMQNSRVLANMIAPAEDIQERNDARDKRVFGQLSGVDKYPLMEKAKRAAGLVEFDRLPGLMNEQTKQTFRQGSPAEKTQKFMQLLQQRGPEYAKQQLGVADNYAGVYPLGDSESGLKNMLLMDFLRKTQGNENAARVEQAAVQRMQNVRSGINP